VHKANEIAIMSGSYHLSLAAAVLLFLAVVTVNVQGFHFYLEGSEQKCFIEELPKDTLVVGLLHCLGMGPIPGRRLTSAYYFPGHYKAEHYSEQLKQYAENPSVGIQIIVEVRLLVLLHLTQRIV
jgi:hypothetical protein